MNDLTATKKFATTIGAEAFAREYDGEYPIVVTVRQLTRKGLVDRKYQIDRQVTDQDLLPVGKWVK